MNTRTAVITGASTGLGLECARALLASDASWHVVLAVRDAARGGAAVGELGEPTRCTVLEVDLASLRSVRTFVETVRITPLPPIHALVCNAGLQVVSGSALTDDGIEMTFAVNHLGHFALVTGILDQLTRPARIVVVSSGTHDPSKHTGMPAPRYTSALDLAHPPADQDRSTEGRRRYTTSKLCNVLFTYELDRRLNHGEVGVTVNAFDPGLMPGSSLARDYPPIQRLAWRYLAPMLRVLPFVHSTRVSGARLAALAVDPRYDGVTGQYFAGLKPIRSSTESYDLAKAVDLWETSERLLSGAA
ncbi:SDR family NAD(P)-dependent oxidoreductase [Mycobacterium riyadhense]|uniref:Alanine-phosphoribitol ligase n=1 Tax=Mycobacterium riyadhense TaxID=486698 RepID=A0A1X2CZ60_9MYCO|nr:SDR family NAD(P)-dependent oxidoreductase [Mycobacterium riyadhense]MCV7147796.1 SDR family NAD(P)-dependent oxidoreductase [Mycobacterium riyadhense]ORW81256.1 alanine-phosphoribitol ligase [Mycobacterium riyadhense]VTP03629.1 short chain dehydrogenase [Mycobacterium riyadhense]